MKTNTLIALLLSLAAARAAAAPDASAASYLAVPNASASPKPSRMIARIWHGRTLASKADAYEKYLNDTGIAKMRTVQGNLGVELLRRNQAGTSDFLVISYWTSIDAVKNYAGSDYAKARPLDRDREFLLDPEPEVVHYEVVRSGAR
jgi:heme-degrading monooxygenase HmoA